MANISYKRHLAKTITWRAVGTLDTILISWVITANPFTGLKIGFSEVLTKMVLYYLHERVWFNIIEHIFMKYVPIGEIYLIGLKRQQICDTFNASLLLEVNQFIGQNPIVGKIDGRWRQQ